ncbi:MAG: ATP-binding cassette domain-containing protein [Rhodospirillaceae bacterium]|nr:ATP-binding cassette domain-containing protein [Rhodospirillaceae bacterium]
MVLKGVQKVRPGSPGFRLVVDRLEIRPGDRLAVVGPSGSGKSTLIDMLALALAPDLAGRFWVADAPADGVGPADRRDVKRAWDAGARSDLARLRGRLFGYVVQTGGLLPFLSVAANIALTQRVAGRPDPDWIAELARRLDLTDLMARLPAQLSVGQRQRVAVARALAHRPPILLADEPTASLDPVNAERVMTALTALVADSGAALVLVTHDAELAGRYDLTVHRIVPAGAGDEVVSHLVPPAPPPAPPAAEAAAPAEVAP